MDGGQRHDRRQILKIFTIGGVATALVLPTSWTRPLVKSVIVPAHAQASPRRGGDGDGGGGQGTTPAPTTTPAPEETTTTTPAPEETTTTTAAPEETTTTHFHRSEHWVVVEGTLQVTKGDEVELLSENQSTYIPIGKPHRLANLGKIPAFLIEVQSGPYLDEDDIVRIEDIYGRRPSE